MKKFTRYPAINIELVKKLFEENKENPTEEIREKIILELYPLVEYITKRYVGNPGVDDENLLSYGVEGLINGISTYDPSTTKSFFTYIDNCISREISKGIGEFYGLGIGFVARFNVLRKQLESYHKEKIEDNPEILDEILQIMCSERYLHENHMEEFKTRILLRMLDTVKDRKPIDFVDTTDYMQILDEDCNEHLKNDVDKMLLRLKPNIREILLRKFGLNDSEVRTFQEIANEFGVERNNIWNRYASGCERIKSRGQILKEYIPYLSEEIDINSPTYGKKKSKK